MVCDFSWTPNFGFELFCKPIIDADSHLLLTTTCAAISDINFIVALLFPLLINIFHLILLVDHLWLWTGLLPNQTSP